MQGPVLVDSMAQEELEMKESPRGAAGVKKGAFPPPLPSLARKSYNHLPLQVPWVLLRANRSNNRVVLHEVKTPGQQMLFQPIRKEGRLVLHMLRHDSSDEDLTDEECSSAPLSSSPSASLSTVLSAEEDALRASI